MSTPESSGRPREQSAPSGGPPRPPKKTARGKGDGSPPGPLYVIKQAALGILALAHRDHAAEVVMGPAADGGTFIRYKLDAGWTDWKTPLGFAWPLVESEVGGLAGIRDRPYPKEGIIYLAYSGVRLRWDVKMSHPGEECALRNLSNEAP